MDRFVCVRLVQCNSLDLSLFQFDFDLTFSVFFMNADKTIYGRYGTRSDNKEATRDISIEGFRAALDGALKLHAAYPGNKSTLKDKQGPPPRHLIPEKYPSLAKFKPTLDYQGQVARSCIHCHQVRDAERRVLRATGKPLADRVVYPWPMPDQLGMKLDAKQRARIVRVDDKSAAQQAQLKAGDEILRINGQPMLSIADVQWALHNAKPPTQLSLLVLRDGKIATHRLPLAEGWRRGGNISWRPTSWDFRRMVTGGMRLESLSEADRRKAKLPTGVLALRAQHVGQYNEHAVAKRAGIKKGDILVEFDGKKAAMSESDLFAYALQNTKPGGQVPVVMLRGGKRLKFVLRMQ
jgi:hypothetical protein